MEYDNPNNTRAIDNGLGFGCVLAVVISWSLYKSVWWAIVHGCFSWFYVLYYLLRR